MKKTTKRAAETEGGTFATGLPYGSGALQMRGNTFWMLYGGVATNTNTDDFGTARRMLAKRAIESLRARIAAIEAAVSDEGRTAPKREPEGRGQADAGTVVRPDRVRSGSGSTRGRGKAR